MLDTHTEIVTKRNSKILGAGAGQKKLVELTKPYVPIYQWCYGRMDESTPWQGLATAGVVSCTVVILHCPNTKRTILSHSPNYLQMNTFVPMLDWCSGGDGERMNTFLQREAWRYGYGAATSTSNPLTIEAVVLRGQTYATAEARNFGHDGWISDFRELCSDVEKARAITISVTDHSRILASGAVTVDKGTGKITFFSLDSSLRGNTVIGGFDNPALTSSDEYGLLMQKRNLFVGGFWYIQQQTFDINLQWDVNRHLHGIPLPDRARELVRSARLNEPESIQSNLLKKFGQPDWISSPLDGSVNQITVLKTTFMNVVHAGMPCERCTKSGKMMVCAKCKGAWYCGAEHQKQDWEVHKGWCKAHKF